jgi:outer membrane protein assembly factor BamB
VSKILYCSVNYFLKSLCCLWVLFFLTPIYASEETPVRDTLWKITEIYVATMGYAPDNEGLQYWAQRIQDEGWTSLNVAQSFFDQPLVKEKYPESLGYDELIEALYKNIFGRSADEMGKAYWLNELTSKRIQKNQMIVTLIEGGWANSEAVDDMARFGHLVDVGLAFAKRQAEKGLAYSTLSPEDQTYLRQAGTEVLANITSAPETRDSAISSINGLIDVLQSRNRVSDWPSFRAGSQHLGENVYEQALSPLTVDGLDLRWEFQTGAYVFSSPAVVNEVVYFGSYNGKFYAIDTITGKALWTVETNTYSLPVISSPAIFDGIVYFGDTDSYFYALDAATGNTLWTFSMGVLESTTAMALSSPAVVNGVVYFGSVNRKVFALDALTGNKHWEFQTGDYVISSPAVAAGVVYIGSLNGKVYALDAATGAKLWEYQTGDEVYSSPAVSDGSVYIGSMDDKLYALDAATGVKRWDFQTGSDISSSPAVADGIVYVGSLDGKIYALDAATGSKRWEFLSGRDSKTGKSGVSSSPAVANGVVYVGAHDNKVYALDAITGNVLWAYRLGGAVLMSSPAVVNGTVYIGAADGKVYAFEATLGVGP